MAVSSIVATAGATNANSYITIAEGQQYADDRLQSSNWGTDATKHAQALIAATSRIDTLQFEGEKAATAQALKWPRVLAFDDNGDEYDTSAIPEVVQRATFELALYLLNQDADSSDPTQLTGLEGFDRVQVGPLAVEPNHGHRAGVLPDEIMRILRPVLLRGGVGFVAELVRA